MLARYFFGSAQVWRLDEVPSHRIEEAQVILRARFEAKVEATKKGASGFAGAATVLLPDF